MKSHPIIFDAESVRAILEGRKTQTRRALKHESRTGMRCPYGQPGDRLWVKESFALEDATEFPDQVPQDGRPVRRIEEPETYETITFARYRASETASLLCRHDDCMDGPCTHPWRSPRLMPLWASRITLEIMEVRAQPVQDISLEGCIAEGISVPGRERMLSIAPIKRESDEAGCRAIFSKVWDSLNEARGFAWSANPWVWAITFRVAVLNFAIAA